MSAVTVVMVGNNTLLWQGLRRVLDPDEFVVAAEAKDAAGAAALFRNGLNPALAVVDFANPQDEDFESLHALREADSACRLVVLANDLQLESVARALKAGADGYLMSDLPVDAFCLALQLVLNGEKVLPGGLAALLASDGHEPGHAEMANAALRLTDREQQILKCLQGGYSNKLIGRALGITDGTVKVHLKSLMKKLGVRNRTQAALWAGSNGIAHGDAPAEGILAPAGSMLHRAPL